MQAGCLRTHQKSRIQLTLLDSRFAHLCTSLRNPPSPRFILRLFLPILRYTLPSLLHILIPPYSHSTIVSSHPSLSHSQDGASSQSPKERSIHSSQPHPLHHQTQTTPLSQTTTQRSHAVHDHDGATSLTRNQHGNRYMETGTCIYI